MVNLFINLRNGNKVISNTGEITNLKQLKDGYIPTIVLDNARQYPYTTWACLTVKDTGEVDKLVGRFSYDEERDSWYIDVLESDECVTVWEYLADNPLIHINACDTIKSMQLRMGLRK